MLKNEKRKTKNEKRKMKNEKWKMKNEKGWGMGDGGALGAWRAAKRWRSHERSETRNVPTLRSRGTPKFYQFFIFTYKDTPNILHTQFS